MTPLQAFKEENHEAVKHNLFKNRRFNLQGEKDDLNKGDTVRRALAKDKIQKFPINWSMELYEIIDVKGPCEPSKPIAYRLKNLDTDQNVKGFYGRSLLQKITGIENKDLVTIKFKVDRILKRFKKGKEWYLLVKWTGYSVGEATEEPEYNIKADLTKKQFNDLMKEFKNRK
jgi:hypothetical protein